MIVFVATLWIAGIGCHIEALVGKDVKIGSIVIPGVAGRRARAGIAVVGAAAFALGAVVFFFPNGFSSPSPAAQPPPKLRFLQPPGPIPHCVTFNGTGAIPKGDDLVLFDRPSDPYGNYTHTQAFGYDGPVDPEGNGWIAPDREIGSGDPSDRGTHIAIVALLVPRNVAHFLDDITSNSRSGQLPVSVIGLGVQTDKITITRNGQNKQCQ